MHTHSTCMYWQELASPLICTIECLFVSRLCLVKWSSMEQEGALSGIIIIIREMAVGGVVVKNVFGGPGGERQGRGRT